MATHAKHPSSPPGHASISIAAAKANFSSLVTSVETKGNPVTILRRGLPVAQLVPFPAHTKPRLHGSMAGTAQELGDIVGPTGELWELVTDATEPLDDDE